MLAQRDPPHLPADSAGGVAAETTERRSTGRSADALLPSDASATTGPRGWLRFLPQPALLLDCQGRCLLANEAWARESGLCRERLTGAGWLESLAPEDRHPLNERLQRETAAQDPQPVIREVQWRSGTVALLNISPLPGQTTESSLRQRGEQPGWVVVATIVSTRGAVDFTAALSASFGRLMQVVPMPVAVADDPQCRRVRINPALRDLCGLEQEVFEGDGVHPPLPGVRVFVDGRELPLNDLPLHRAAREGVPVLGQAVRVEVGGRSIELLSSAVPLRDAQGRVSGALAVYADITSQTSLASALAQSRDELRMALLAAESANRSRDRFLAMVSHELRTPLTPALVTLTQVLRELRPREGRNELVRELDLVRRSIELEARLIDDLLDLTRIARGRMRLTCRGLDLHDALRDVLRLIRPRIDTAGLRLDLHLAASNIRIIGDETRLRQVLWNLLSNAIAYNRPGGSIRVSSANPAENVVQIEITDTGMGIEAQELSGLFLPFEQVQSRPRNREGGLGLGLTISKGLVDLHGGTLRARSAGPGEGATFTVELPTADAPDNAALRPGGPCGSQGGTEGRSLDILLIDDHPDTLRAMRRLLQKLGHRVTIAASVESVREVVAARDEPFDLLVSDIGLPDGSGHDIPPILKKAFPSQPIPAIALSGYGMDSDLQASKTAGFARHLVKPISLDQLQDVIREVTGTA